MATLLLWQTMRPQTTKVGSYIELFMLLICSILIWLQTNKPNECTTNVFMRRNVYIETDTKFCLNCEFLNLILDVDQIIFGKNCVRGPLFC